MKIVERTFNAITGETTDIERDATPDELANIERARKEALESAAKEKEIAESKSAILLKLGITEEEAKILLS